MRHNRQLRVTENLLEGILAVNEHVARARSHEQFYARHAVPVEFAGLRGIAVCRTEEERIVYVACPCRDVKFLPQGIYSGGLRHGVRHVEERCHAAVCCGAALAPDVGLLRHAWLAEVHMLVYYPRQSLCPLAVNHLGVPDVWRVAVEYLLYAVITNKD